VTKQVVRGHYSARWASIVLNRNQSATRVLNNNCYIISDNFKLNHSVT